MTKTAVSLLLLLVIANASCTATTVELSPTRLEVSNYVIDNDRHCHQQFVPHELDHTTIIAGEQVEMFDSNGAGLAINDLDNDSDLDMVLANLKGHNAIFWNEG